MQEPILKCTKFHRYEKDCRLAIQIVPEINIAGHALTSSCHVNVKISYNLGLVSEYQKSSWWRVIKMRGITIVCCHCAKHMHGRKDMFGTVRYFTSDSFLVSHDKKSQLRQKKNRQKVAVSFTAFFLSFLKKKNLRTLWNLPKYNYIYI